MYYYTHHLVSYVTGKIKREDMSDTWVREGGEYEIYMKDSHLSGEWHIITHPYIILCKYIDKFVLHLNMGECRYEKWRVREKHRDKERDSKPVKEGKREMDLKIRRKRKREESEVGKKRDRREVFLIGIYTIYVWEEGFEEFVKEEDRGEERERERGGSQVW